MCSNFKFLLCPSGTILELSLGIGRVNKDTQVDGFCNLGGRFNKCFKEVLELKLLGVGDPESLQLLLINILAVYADE